MRNVLFCKKVSGSHMARVFFDGRKKRGIRGKSLEPGFGDSPDAISSVFLPEIDNTCSQLHVGSGFLKKD